MLKKRAPGLLLLGACALLALPVVWRLASMKETSPSPLPSTALSPSPAPSGRPLPPKGEEDLLRQPSYVKDVPNGQLDDATADRMRTLATSAPDPETRWSAVNVLVKSQDPDTLFLLQDRILNDVDKGVRASAVKALADLEDPEALPILLEALKDVETPVRLAVLKALATQGDNNSLKFIKPLEKSKSPEIRAAAEQASASIRLRETK